jgi:hypothetical protein
MVVIVIERQSLVDIAIQEYGSAEAIFQLLEDDPTVNEVVTIDGIEYQQGLMSNLHAGQMVKVKSSPLDPQVQEFYKRNKLKPASSFEMEHIPLDSVTPDFNQFDFNPEDFH